MSGFLNFIQDSGFVGWTIILTGFGATGLVVERIRTLYFHYGLNVNDFTMKVFNLVMSKKNEELSKYHL